MVSTAEDYAQFAQMLVNGGELNGRRYLGTRTVQLMATNHTGDLVNGQFGRPAAGMGFGLGVQVVEDPALAGLRQSKGSWGWAGAYGTNVNIEPAEKMVTDHHDADVHRGRCSAISRTPSSRRSSIRARRARL